MADFPEVQLFQSRPADTNAVSVHSPNGKTKVTRIFVCNTSGAGSSFRLFHDEDGTTYDETTALHWNTAVGADTTVVVADEVDMNNASGNLAVRSANANALTFTGYGYEKAE